MDPEDYPSDSDASDEDFCPDKESGDSVSEVDSDDNLEYQKAENDEEPCGKKKRKRKTKATDRKKVKLEENSSQEKESAKDEHTLDDEDEERLTDALWADFLAGNGNTSSSASASSNTTPLRKGEQKSTIDSKSKPEKLASESAKTTVTKVFEFAGEAVEVTEEIPKSKIDTSISTEKMALGASNGKGSSLKPFVGRSSGGGLGAVLSQIGKKNKLSTLEKTKLDWNSFKRSQGIEEELQTHNKGKEGYLERQDFLQRADLRQFEIEKSFRQTSRSNR